MRSGCLLMLAAAMRWVRPDGFVIYATCSLQREEGEEIVKAVTSDRLAKLDKFTSTELGLFAPAISAEGWARILPTCLNIAKFPDAAAGSDNPAKVCAGCKHRSDNKCFDSRNMKLSLLWL